MQLLVLFFSYIYINCMQFPNRKLLGERRSFANLTENPHAAYLYREDVPGYKGVRLYLIKTHIETDPAKIESMRRKKHGREVEGNKAPSKYLVYFHIDEIRPLVGDR